MNNQEALEILYRWHAEVTGFLLDENNRPSESLRKELKEQQEVFLIAIKAMLEVERLREERRWIPVSERWPDVGGHVLVVYDDGFMLTSTVDEFDHGVTHWMPLPAPPNTEEKGA